MRQVRLEHGGEQVVRGADRVDVAREVEVDQVHRGELGAPPAGAAALDPEDRSEGRLAQAEDCGLTDTAEGLGERDSRCGLSLAGFRRGHPGDRDEVAVRRIDQALESGQLDLGRTPAVGLQLLRQQAEPLAEISDGIGGLQRGRSVHGSRLAQPGDPTSRRSSALFAHVRGAERCWSAQPAARRARGDDHEHDDRHHVPGRVRQSAVGPSWIPRACSSGARSLTARRGKVRADEAQLRPPEAR